MSYWRSWVAGVWVCAILAVSLSTGPAWAQADAGGCDEDGQKGVVVPCAGIEFCTCADKCTTASDCASECCSSNVCVPKCVCEGAGVAEPCDVGDWPPNARESESGGCAVDRLSPATAPAGSWASVGIVVGLFAWSRRRRAKKEGRSARS